RAASLRRRLARLRRTAPPTLRLAVNPTPMGPASARRRPSTMRLGLAARRPARTNRNCPRFLRRWRGGPLMRPGDSPALRSGREALAALGAAPGQGLLAALGGHAGAEAMAALPHEP